MICGQWVLLGAAGAVVYRASHRSGVTNEEFKGQMPGDELILDPAVEWTRATTIDAPPELVWPWLAQMGFGRGGWYTSRAFDRLVWRLENPSSDVLIPELQQPTVGDVIPDGPDDAAYFRLADVVPEERIVYRSTCHPYRGHPVDPTDPKQLTELEEKLISEGIYLDFTWSWALRHIRHRRTRLLVRTRAKYSPGWLATTEVPLGLVDFYHVATMFKGIAERVAANSQA